MPYYTCSNAACPTAGAAFNLSSPGQTFCPNCFSKTLRAAPTPVVAPATQTRVLRDSNPMDAVGGDADEVEQLIQRWDINTVSDVEARKTKDYLFKLGTDKRKRIDREGGVTVRGGGVTHGKFRLQFGDKTYAGLHIRVDEIMDVATIRRAWRESVAAQRYVEVYLG